VRYGSVRFGTHVEQEIASFRRYIDEGPDQFVGRFPILVVGPVPPRVVHRYAAFPIDARQAGVRHLLLRRSEIACIAWTPIESSHPLAPLPHAIVDDDVLLQRAYIIIEVLAVGFRPPVDPLSIEPEDGR